MPRWVLALALGALVFSTDDYVIAGVLPEIAEELKVSEGTAGQLVTAFSVTVAVAAPIAAIATARVRPRAVLTTAAAVFTVANALAAVAPGFESLLALRVVAALAAATATPALFGLAARLAPPERIGRYVAAVAFGVTGAIAFGVPAGTWIGGALGWRATFTAMAVCGVLVGLGFATQTPRGDASPALSLRSRLAILVRPAISLGLTANVTLMLGSMMLLTYLAPFTAELSTGDVGTRGALFAFSGVAGMVGLWAGGIATDRWGPDRTLAAGVGVFVLTMAALAALWTVRPVPVAALLPVVALQGAAAFWNSPAVQARLHRLAGPVSAQALAMNTSGTYLGAALGGAVGGLAVDGFGPAPLPLIAGAAGFVALGLFLLAARAATPRACEPERRRWLRERPAERPSGR